MINIDESITNTQEIHNFHEVYKRFFIRENSSLGHRLDDRVFAIEMAHYLKENALSLFNSDEVAKIKIIAKMEMAEEDQHLLKAVPADMKTNLLQEIDIAKQEGIEAAKLLIDKKLTELDNRDPIKIAYLTHEGLSSLQHSPSIGDQVIGHLASYADPVQDFTLTTKAREGYRAMLREEARAEKRSSTAGIS